MTDPDLRETVARMAVTALGGRWSQITQQDRDYWLAHADAVIEVVHTTDETNGENNMAEQVIVFRPGERFIIMGPTGEASVYWIDDAARPVRDDSWGVDGSEIRG